MASHAHRHFNHDDSPWLPLMAQHGIQRERYWRGTLAALVVVLIVLGTLILWGSL